MSNVARGAIIFVAAVVVGAYTYASASDLDRNGAFNIVFSPAFELALIVFSVLAVALVNRWWALSLALVPLAVDFYLHEATDYVYPFHEDPYPSIAIVGTGFLLVIYSLGFLLRAVFDRMAPGGPGARKSDR
jgi:hypothetical protein